MLESESNTEMTERPKRKRIKGFAQFASYDSGYDEYVEIPEECPNVACAGINMINIGEYY
jgi:hypothetical protein